MVTSVGIMLVTSCSAQVMLLTSWASCCHAGFGHVMVQVLIAAEAMVMTYSGIGLSHWSCLATDMLAGWLFFPQLTVGIPAHSGTHVKELCCEGTFVEASLCCA